MNSFPGQVLGNYRLVSLIGKGGFSSVYQGEHSHLHTKAAIKILDASNLSEYETKSFLEEAKIVAELRHPNIIRLLDFSTQDGRPFLVMEYVSGGSLANRHPKGSILTLSQAVSYTKQVTAALQYAHKQGVVHRDVKPSNMLVQENGEIVLSDFGIAVMRDDTSLITGKESIVGTAAFMAPEQILGRARAASDQYSLAVSVYFWLCGVYPFQGDFVQIVSQHVNTPPPSPSQFNPTIPSTVEQVLLKALAKKPEDRFGSIEEFGQSLERASLGQEVAIEERGPSFPSISSTGELSAIQDDKILQTLAPQGLAAINQDAYQTYYPQPPYGQPPALAGTVRNLRHILPSTDLLLHTLSLFFTYLFVIPLLLVVSPLLLAIYYLARARLKARGTILEIPKQRGRMATMLLSLPLPEGFWLTKLLTSKPILASPPQALSEQHYPSIESAQTIIQSPKTVQPQSLPAELIDKRQASWLKAAWNRAAYFIVKGPSSLPTAAQPQTHMLPRLQQANTQAVTISGVRTSVGRPFSDAQPGMRAAPGKHKNFCLMYHNNDRTWAEWIAWLLEEDGLSTIMPEWDFRAGYNVDKEVRKAISEAERVIVIVSPDYLDTRNTQWGTIFSREVMSQEGTILPIIVKECTLRKPLDTLVSINLVGRDILHTSEKLRQAASQKRTKPTTPPEPPEPLKSKQDKEKEDKEKDDDKDKTILFRPLSKEKTISLPQMAAQIESAFNRKDWPDVIRKSRFLTQHLPYADIPWKIYRMQALAYHAQGQIETAQMALENALALVSNREERLALLDEYANALASIQRWQEMLVYIEEALTIEPNDIRWQALRQHVTKQLGQEKSDVQDYIIREANPPKDAGKSSDKLKNLDQMQTMVMPTNPISIFIAYALNDAELCANLKNQLTTLIYEHQLRIWYDHDISPGEERLKIMKERLDASHMIILLVSASFLASEYHYQQMQIALEMHHAGKKRVIPVLLRPSDWEKTPLGKLQALPKDNRPVTTWPDRDEAFVDIVKGIRLAVENLPPLQHSSLAQ